MELYRCQGDGGDVLTVSAEGQRNRRETRAGIADGGGAQDLIDAVGNRARQVLGDVGCRAVKRCDADGEGVHCAESPAPEGRGGQCPGLAGRGHWEGLPSSGIKGPP